MSGTGPLVVVGDAFVDVDVEGTAHRLCPDAPAPVVDDAEERRRPGGAGLAALLAFRDTGREVVLVTAVADDADGADLARLLAEAGVGLVPLATTGTTVVKRRVRADGHTLARIDSGAPGETGPASPEAVAAMDAASTVLAADYGRGVVAGLAAELGAAARRRPLVWDPHPRGHTPVPDARLVTPNLAEAGTFAALPERAGENSWAVAARRAATLRERWASHAVAVTLGARGALLAQDDAPPTVVPARAATGDPCGAGDRFAAAAACALADGALTSEAVAAAVDAAARFVAEGGVSALGREPEPATADPLALVRRVRAAGGTVVATGGCFDLLHAGHVATLEAARALGDCLVVCVNSDSSVRRLKGPTRPLVPEADRTRVLAALAPVDGVLLFDEDTPEVVLRELRPDVWVKGGDYAGVELPEAPLLREWGGQAVVVPYLDGRSTSRLVEVARA